jgi:hypothetical protein
MTQIGTERPQFDYITMQREWSDYLVASGHQEEPDHKLVAELTKIHSAIFAEQLYGWDVRWDDLNGVFGMNPGVANILTPPTVEELDTVWYDIFEMLAANIEDIERALASPEV